MYVMLLIHMRFGIVFFWPLILKVFHPRTAPAFFPSELEPSGIVTDCHTRFYPSYNSSQLSPLLRLFRLIFNTIKLFLCFRTRREGIPCVKESHACEKAQFRSHHLFLLITKYREAQSWENAESSQAFDMSKNIHDYMIGLTYMSVV